MCLSIEFYTSLVFNETNMSTFHPIDGVEPFSCRHMCALIRTSAKAILQI